MMRNQWRLLLRGRHSLLSPQPSISMLRHFSSDPAPGTTTVSAPLTTTVIDIFSKSISGDEIKQHLDSNNIAVSHDLALEVLKNLKSNPDVATRFFDWILERDSHKLSSNSYNLMVGILGSNGFFSEFWDMVETMRNKGYGVKKGAYDCVLDKFNTEGMEIHLQRLKGLFDYRKSQESIEVISARISQIIKPSVWGDDVETKIKELGAVYSTDLVKMVVESLSTEPMKALIFFKWVDESGLFKHDEQTYNAMAVVLGREDCVGRFWNVVGEMKSAGYEIRIETFVKVLERFSKRKMMKDCVDLYQVAMGSGNNNNKPSVQDCSFILRKIAAAGSELDMDLFTRVLRIVAESGAHELPDSTVNAVLKSLAGVGRLGQSRLVLDAMRASGLQTSSRVQGNVGFRLSRAGMSNEANVYVQDLESSADHHTWISLFKGHCLAGDVSNALECFQKSVDSMDSADVGHNVELLVDLYCRKGKAKEASGILTSLVKEKGLKPKHTTYKMVISQLLASRRGLGDAVELIELMKGDGYPPYLDPFVEYVTSKGRGTAKDALVFLKAVSVKKFPATSVFLRVFEGYFKGGRTREAQSLLAICPQYIRNNADVLDVFYNNVTKASEAEAEAVSAS